MEDDTRRYHFLTVSAIIVFIFSCIFFLLIKEKLIIASEITSNNSFNTSFQFGLKQLWTSNGRYFFLLLLLCIMKPKLSTIIATIFLFFIAHTIGSYIGSNNLPASQDLVICFATFIVILYLSLTNIFQNPKRHVRVSATLLSGLIFGLEFSQTLEKNETATLNTMQTIYAGSIAIAGVLLALLLCIYFPMLKWIAGKSFYAKVIAIPVSITIGIFTMITTVDYLFGN